MCCKTEYDFCPNCGSGRLAPAWKAAFCSETCKELWQTLSRFSMNFITKSEAKSIISKLDLEPMEFYASCVQRDYAKVMAEEKKPKRGKRAEMPIVNEAIGLPKEVIDSIVEELVEIKVEQPIEAVEPVVEESTAHEVVTIENE
jgi:hypothetical protein